MDKLNKFDKPYLGKVSPFYALPPTCRKTSAEIINEARAAIKESNQMNEGAYAVASVKPIDTQRPFTPREKSRIFFGKKSKNSRPPSAFSLKYLQNEHTEISEHKSSNSNDLKDEKIFNLNVQDLFMHKIKLPSLDSKNKKFTEGTSLDNLPEEIDNADTKNVFSKPKEKTKCNERTSTPFEYPNKTESLILEPQNLDKIFGNKQIIQDSENLFIKQNYWANQSIGKKSDDMDVSINELLNTLSENETNENKAIDLLNDLLKIIDENIFLRTNLNSKMKIKILKCLYKFVESQNDKLLLLVATIILMLRVTGNNLSGVCKLIFKISRNDKNDHLFQHGNVLELFVDSLGRSSPLDDAEACVYAYGAIKFLTMNLLLVEKILDLGILQLMVLHIKIVNAARAEKLQIPEQTNHGLYQLTGALRNLASEEKIFDDFVSHGVILELCYTMELFSSDIDIVSNIVRTLSIVSTHDLSCTVIANYKNINKIFVKIFEKYPGKEKIIVRLGYTMGNLVAKSDEARTNFYNEKQSVDCLINTLNIYLQKYLNCGLKMDETAADVIVKIVRIIANSAINAEIGKALILSHGINLIEIFLLILFTKSAINNEELTLSVLSTLNNLSYYYDADNDKDAFFIKQIDLTKALSVYIDCNNNDCIIESIRVLGNLSRSQTTRDFFVQSLSFQILIDILERDNSELLRTTMGVFVNLMADFQNRIIFKQDNGVFKLINVLQSFGHNDWPLSMLVCQVIWNYCIDSTNLYDVFDGNEVEQLLNILVDYLDEEKLFGITDSKENIDILMSQEYHMWDEFANVATNLLEKIEYFLDNVDPLQSYSDDEDLIVPLNENKSLNILPW